MQAYQLDTTIPQSRRVEITLPDTFPSGNAEIIILAKSPTAATEGMSLREFSDWLEQQPPTGRKEEIDAQIAEERNSWEGEECDSR